MTRRMWAWAGGLLALAAVLLATSVDSFVHWHAPSDDPHQTLDLNQLLGFIVAGALLLVVAAILLTGYRTAHGKRPFQRDPQPR